MVKPISVDAIHLHSNDNIGVATRNLNAGEVISVATSEITLQEDVPTGHKFALESLTADQQIFKYGQSIGITSDAIGAGHWVHTHNLANGDLNQEYEKATEIPEPLSPIEGRTFQGFRRKNGKAGTRNYIAVISTVNCSASVSKYVAQRFDHSALEDYPNIDGVVALTHGFGCGIEFGGMKHQMLNRVMGGMAKHPNVGAFLLIGLGCEQTSLDYLLEDQKLVQIDGVDAPSTGPPVFTIQETGGTVKTVEAGVRALTELLPRANEFKREAIPASELVVGLECGGSDGYSGITANPALGVASDRVVACGGTAILSETTEIYGAEHLLTRRARTPEVADKLLDQIEWWKWYANTFDTVLDSNPTVGNKLGGLTTITEKSLGAVAKAGSSMFREFYQYAEPVTERGFVIMDTPGFDPPSVTGMVAGGANIVVFTTGRGSCFGCKPTPSIKVMSNTPTYERLQDDMDVNAGTVLSGKSVKEVGEEIFEEILAVASGKKTKSETHGIGDEEFVPWTVGPDL
ncbi:MAG: altronate dehydratase family protein [Planctomycetota bacterium]|nr:altronate dehydratase family protein [Planctomycetota bacterium]